MNKKLLAAALVAAACPSIVAAQSVDLNIIGRIVPTACTPTLTGGSTIDLGGINAGTLSQTAPTALTKHETELTITCDAPAMIQITVVDNRAGTGAGVPGVSWFERFGLGKAPGDVDIGGFVMRNTAQTIDGGPVTLLRKKYSTGDWHAWSNVWAKLNGGHTYYSGGDSVAAGPKAGLVHTVALSVEPWIDRADGLPTANEIPIDGSVTFEVTQL